MVSKRKRNHIEKAISKVKGADQILVQQQQQQQQQRQTPELLENEFTIHKSIYQILRTFVNNARELEVNKKRMVNRVAEDIEAELKNVNRPELICHISDVILSVLRRNKVKWSIAYLRKTLPEKYKDPVKRQSALTRFQRAGPPGTPPDTGMTVEELESTLNRKPSGWGKEYVVKCNLDRRSVDSIKPIIIARHDDTDEYTRRYPIIVTVKPEQQDATVEFDIEEYTKIINTKDKTGLRTDWREDSTDSHILARHQQQKKSKSKQLSMNQRIAKKIWDMPSREA
ncbi:MAG: hypothetical protein ACRD8Z_05550 [Nitrososphaeraceae archaeon]